MSTDSDEYFPKRRHRDDAYSDDVDLIKGTGLGSDYDDPPDYTPSGTVKMITQDQFNQLRGQNPSIPAKTPKAYYTWLFGPGKVVPSSNPAQDPGGQYFAPNSGDVANTRHPVPSWNPADPADMQLVRAGLMAAAGSGLASGIGAALPSFGNGALANLASSALKSGLTGSIMSGIQGGDPIRGGLMGAAGGLLGTGANQAFRLAGIPGSISKYAVPAVTGGIMSAAQGGNPMIGAGIGAVTSGIGDIFSPPENVATKEASWGVNPRQGADMDWWDDLTSEFGNAGEVANIGNPAINWWDTPGARDAVDSMGAIDSGAVVPGWDEWISGYGSPFTSDPNAISPGDYSGYGPPGSAGIGGVAKGVAGAVGASAVPSWLRSLLPTGPNGELDLSRLIGTGLGTALGVYGAGEQSRNLREIADKYMNLDQSRFDTLLGREDAAIKRQQDAMGLGINREDARFNTLLGREDQAIKRQQDAMNLGISREDTRFGTLLGREDQAIQRQKDAIRDAQAVGAPYRSKLSDLYANPSSFLSSPEVTVPVQQASDIMARSLSTKGNPTGSGNALQQLQSYSADQLFGKLGQEKDRLAGYGGLGAYGQAGATVPSIGTTLPSGTSTPIPGVGTSLPGGTSTAIPGVGSSLPGSVNTGGLAALMGAAQSTGDQYQALGSGISNVFNPPKTGAQALAEILKYLGSR